MGHKRRAARSWEETRPARCDAQRFYTPPSSLEPPKYQRPEPRRTADRSFSYVALPASSALVLRRQHRYSSFEVDDRRHIQRRGKHEPLHARGQQGRAGKLLDGEELLAILDVFGEDGLRAYIVGHLEGLDDAVEYLEEEEDE